MTDDPPSRRVPMRLIAVVFAAMFGLLALGYVLFLRPAYVEVFANLRASDAAAVVAQLEAKGIAYRLAANGATVMVPADQADQARLAIAGSDVALKGGVGFELFNKSDMGLTDFAQRINYQRALQGELERTIMMMDEVDSARVHLAMPERALFRSERSPAKAAVEIIAKPGRQLDDARVAGIQQLVAFSVPDLAPGDVAVLDDSGRVLSQVGEPSVLLTPEAEARQAVERYYRARVRAALEPALPGIQMEVKAIALGDGAVATPAPTPAAAPGKAAATSGAAKRDFRLRVIVATSAPLNAEQTGMARNTAIAAAGLDEASGDELDFQVGIATAGDAAGPALPAASPVARPTPAAATAAEIGGPSYWLILVLLAAVAVIAVMRRAPQQRLSLAERDAMIERLRGALREPETAHAG